MPQINRIRIINFTYNNDKRHIIDEKFNFYKGENALLSLANGGGKSVLVQLMMQPIVPLIKIQGRNVKDFFKRKKTPTYVLVEWKLDDMGGYLLTGICIANREVQARENQDTENSIKYFTFTSQYSGANLYDIENIPLCEKNANYIEILPFKDAAVLIQEKSRDSKFNIEYFPQDEGARYRSHLISFNLSQDEWRNIIAKINSDEGGIIEIFEKCKTAQQLMREWMIKTVEKVLYRDPEDQSKLELMLENIVEEIIGNEQYIYEKSILEEFLSQVGELGGVVEKLVKGYDEQKKTEDELFAMYRYLVAESIVAKETIEKNEGIIEEQNRLIRTINLEERSLTYYKWKDDYDRLQLAHEDIKQQLESTYEKLGAKTKQRDIYKAAEIYGEIRLLETELASIEEEIIKVKGEGIEQDKIKSLEYSLKLSYEKRLMSVDEQIEKIYKDIKTHEELITNYIEEESSFGKRIEQLNHQKGILEKGIADFLKYEEKIKKIVGFIINRNLFGEADNAELDKTKKYLQDKHQTLIKEKEHLENSILEKQQRHQQIKIDTVRLREEERELAKRIDEKARERGLYLEAEEELKVIFSRYGLDFEKRFFHEEIQRELKEVTTDLRESQFGFQRDFANIRKTIESIKNGTLHISDEFARFLEENDINYETGENYLQKQDVDLRQDILNNNPILPYAFILTDEDIGKLKFLYPEYPIYQLIPIISYASLDENLNAAGRLVDSGKGTSLLCLYNQRMINADDMEEYLMELESESRDISLKLKHYTESLELAQKDNVVVCNFKFDRGYLHKFEMQLSEMLKQADSIKFNIKILEEESAALEDAIRTIYQGINDKGIQINDAANNLNLFSDFLEENTEYEDNLKKHNQCNGELKSSRQKLEELKKLSRQVLEIKHKLEVNKQELIRLRTDDENNYSRYKSAEEAEVLEQDIEIMEARLDVLRREVTATLDRLEREQESRNKDIKRKQKEIDNLKLQPEQYQCVRYDALMLEALEKELQDLNKIKSEQDAVERKIDREKAKAEGQVNTALGEIKKLAELPIPKDEIKMDFDRRKKECRKVIDEKELSSRNLNDKNKLYSKIMTEIKLYINIENYDAVQVYTVRRDIREDSDTLIKELRRLQSANMSDEKTLNNMYMRMVNDYSDKNSNIANIFKGLEPVKQQAEEDPDNYYYLYERIMNQKDVLGDMIRVYESQLENLERNKNDMVTQSYLHAVQLYEEVQKITRDSSIRLSGKFRPVPMLRITMVPPEDSIRSMDRMRGYIESCIALVRDDMKKEKKQEEIRKNIQKYMSSWELLNVISDLSKLKIEAYKIDINVNNSQYKTWEQVMKENSGGERFVSFFAVLAALMTYTRTSGRAEDDYARNKDTKVLIMDNPFGPISSEHLLNPLFEIARKYNTQLICLTDLKQNSILNCFNLIYMLKVRTSTFGTNEYLKVEEQVREGIELEKDENLEKAVFKAGEYEQMQLV